MASVPDGWRSSGKEIVRQKYGSGPPHDGATVGKGRCQGPKPVCRGSVGEGVTGRSAWDSIVIEDAAPGCTGRGAVVFPIGWEVEAEFVDGGLEADSGEGFGQVLEGSHSL